VFIIPQAQLVAAARHLAANYTNIRCWRYPDLAWAPPAEEETDGDGKAKSPLPLYGQFHQVVLLASRRRAAVAPAEAIVRQITEWANAGTQLTPIPTEPHALAPLPRWQVPASDNSDHEEGEGGVAPAQDGSRALPPLLPAMHTPATPAPAAGLAADAQSALDAVDDRVVPRAADEGATLGRGTPELAAAAEDHAGAAMLLPAPASMPGMPGLDASPARCTPMPVSLEFADTSLDLDALARRLETATTGVWASDDYRAQRWPDLARLRLGMDRPLGPLRLGHLITLAAVGLLNGRVLTGPDGRRLLVKGACRKEVVTEEDVEHGPGGRQTLVKTETERFAIALWAVDLSSGELIHIV
jgi:hypothetical protein